MQAGRDKPEAEYAQVPDRCQPILNPDGLPRIKEQRSYPDSSCKGKCMYFLCCRCSKRYYTAWLSNLGFMITFGLRCNMTWAMLTMQGLHRHQEELLNQVQHSELLVTTQSGGHPANAHHLPLTVNDSTTHGVHPSSIKPWAHKSPGHVIDIVGLLNVTTIPDFYWTASERGFVDSSFFYGYLVTQIPGGIIAAKFPANRLFGIAVGGSAFLNLFLPAACRVHYGLVMFIRVLQGLVEGTSYPACHGIWRYWAPPLERSRLATIAFCGSYAGAVLGLSLSGLLAEKMGWQSPFYVYGIVGILWFVWWWRVTHEKPSLHPTITEAERIYIEESLGESPNVIESKIPIPWKKMFTSMPVYAIIVANFARSWSFYLLIIKSPKYFREVFHYDLAHTGFLAALPHLVMAIIVPLGGQLADRLRKKLLTTTYVRKIFNCGGFGLEAVFLIGVGYSKTITSAIVCLVLAVGSSGFAISGYNVNHLDIAPRYASILMGISNGVGTISGMICPLSAELLTKGERKEGWSTVFLTASLVHFTGVIFYAIFASGEKQHWAEAPDEAISNWHPPNDLPPEMAGTEYGYADEAQQQAYHRPPAEQISKYSNESGLEEPEQWNHSEGLKARKEGYGYTQATSESRHGNPYSHGY